MRLWNRGTSSTLIKKNFNADALDISDSMLRMAKEKTKNLSRANKINFIASDVEKFLLENQRLYNHGNRKVFRQIYTLLHR